MCFNQHAGLIDDDVDVQIIGSQYMKQELKAASGRVIVHRSLSSLSIRAQLLESVVVIELKLARKVFVSFTVNVDWLCWATYRQRR